MNLTRIKKTLYSFLSKHTTGKLREKFTRSFRKYQWPLHNEGLDNIITIYLNNKPIRLDDLGGIPNTNIHIKGNHNHISIHVDEFINNIAFLNLFIEANHNEVVLNEEVRGEWNLSLHGNNNHFSVGEKTACGDFSATLHSNEVYIGHHCMISAKEELWTDGHSVIDCETKKCLNVPKAPIIIGNHVWLGRRVTLTKGAQIPDDCIVGIGSIVTKAFTETNCVLAGSPARIVKRGINWDGRRPMDYDHQ